MAATVLFVWHYSVFWFFSWFDPRSLFHGDLCLSNILYDSRLNTFRAIDPWDSFEGSSGCLFVSFISSLRYDEVVPFIFRSLWFHQLWLYSSFIIHYLFHARYSYRFFSAWKRCLGSESGFWPFFWWNTFTVGLLPLNNIVVLVYASFTFGFSREAIGSSRQLFQNIPRLLEMTTLVLPMLGLGSRFAKAGYFLPKYLLPLCGRPVLYWTLYSFRKCLDWHLVFVVRHDHIRYCIQDLINDYCREIGFNSFEILVLDWDWDKLILFIRHWWILTILTRFAVLILILYILTLITLFINDSSIPSSRLLRAQIIGPSLRRRLIIHQGH